jgi:hypothetical protein
MSSPEPFLGSFEIETSTPCIPGDLLFGKVRISSLPSDIPGLLCLGLSREELLPFVRVLRSKRLKDVDALVLRHQSQLLLSHETTLSEAEFLQVLTYSQALRDFPADFIRDLSVTDFPKEPVFNKFPLRGVKFRAEVLADSLLTFLNEGQVLEASKVTLEVGMSNSTAGVAPVYVKRIQGCSVGGNHHILSPSGDVLFVLSEGVWVDVLTDASILEGSSYSSEFRIEPAEGL